MTVSKTKAKLVDVARQLFAKMGVENTTMNDIALASKKGRRTLYTYFKSKDEIYLAVVESELDILSDMMKRVADKDISPDKKIIEMIYTRLDAVKEVVYRNGTLRANFFRDIWRVEKVRKRFDAKEMQLFKSVLKEGQDKGVFHVDDVEMTAAWEDTLARIESGEADAAAFRRDIEAYTAQIVTELLETKVSVAPSESEYPCPKCRNSRVLFFPKVVKCADVDCGFTLFRNKGGKELSDKQLAELLTKGRTGVIKGFKSRDGKAFDASLVLRPDFSVGYEFADKKPSKGKSAKRK